MLEKRLNPDAGPTSVLYGKSNLLDYCTSMVSSVKQPVNPRKKFQFKNGDAV